jgi:hypothetical protein
MTTNTNAAITSTATAAAMLLCLGHPLDSPGLVAGLGGNTASLGPSLAGLGPSIAGLGNTIAGLGATTAGQGASIAGLGGVRGAGLGLSVGALAARAAIGPAPVRRGGIDRARAGRGI